VDTHARILATFEHLLEERAIDDISVAVLAREAGCSMSSLYARFPTKDALVEAFFDEFFSKAGGEAAATLAGPPAVSLRAAVERLVAFLVRGHRRNRGVLRAMVLYDRQHPESSFGGRTKRLQHGFAEAVARMLVAAAPATERDMVRERAVFGLWLVNGAVQQAILMDKLSGVDDAQLEHNLSTMWLAYLTAV
jgi:AcrR family transcriptional regulator